MARMVPGSRKGWDGVDRTTRYLDYPMRRLASQHISSKGFRHLQAYARAGLSKYELADTCLSAAVSLYGSISNCPFSSR